MASKDTTANKDTNEDPSDNPFYVHHSDSPTAVLVSPPHTGDNYSTWARAMRMALRAKNKLVFVTGEISQSFSSFQLPQWEKCNDLQSELHALYGILSNPTLIGVSLP